MKNSIRIIGFLFIAFLMAAPCRSGGSDTPASRTVASGAVGSEAKKAVEAGNHEPIEKPPHKEAALSYKTLILTVGSSPVYWPEFYFWLNYIQKYYRNYHQIDKITDWNVEQNGMSLREFFLSTAVGYACKDRAIEKKAKDLGIELSARDSAEIEKQRKDNIKIYGSESEYIRIVSSMYVTEDVFKYLTKIDYLGNYMFEQLYGAKGEKCSDKDVLAYVKTAGLMCAKYIFLSNTDAAGNDITPEKRADNFKLLEDILVRLDKSDTPLVLFDDLADKYGEDRTMSSYPDGRLFVSGGMDKDFESAYLKLKDNAYSGIVRTDEGYYIILRKPITPDMTADPSGNTLRYRTAYDQLFKNQVEEWSSKMEVKYEDAYYKIDVEGLQDK